MDNTNLNDNEDINFDSDKNNFQFVTNEQSLKIQANIVNILEGYVDEYVLIFDGHNIYDDCLKDNFEQIDSDKLEEISGCLLYRIFNEADINQFNDDIIKNHVSEVLSIELDQVYNCTRSWTAWSYDTMTGDDFEKFIESEIFPNITSAITQEIFQGIINAEKIFITKNVDIENTENNKITKRL